MKILSFDPGKNDFAYAVINAKGKVTAHGFVRSITTMTSDKFGDEITRFLLDVDHLLDLHKPDVVALERMQHRPHLGGGAVVEYINLMIGMVLTRAHDRGLAIFVFPPVTWKGHMKRLYGVKTKDLFTMIGQKMSMKLPRDPANPKAPKTKGVWVKGVLDDQAGADKIQTHEGDAIGIGCYAWYSLTRIDIVRSVI